jgi:hypothetical protein
MNKMDQFSWARNIRFQRPVKKYSALFLLAILSACGDQVENIPSQSWHGVDVHVETRPSPPRTGMNEFLIMATNKHGQPVYNFIVSIRTSDQDPWVQAIQDGEMGVYRRAAEVARGARSVVQVQIKRNDEESVLRFPLTVAE